MRSRTTSMLLTFLLAFTPIALANDKYSVKDTHEIDVFAAVLQAEVVANGWSKKELICLDIDGGDPDKKLVAALRRQHLNVRSEAEWRRNFTCGFTVRVQPVHFESPKVARVSVSTIDNREINTGRGDLAILIRDGEYLLHNDDGRWSITKYEECHRGL
jgi:hypothetical protein